MEGDLYVINYSSSLPLIANFYISKLNINQTFSVQSMPLTIGYQRKDYCVRNIIHVLDMHALSPPWSRVGGGVQSMGVGVLQKRWWMHASTQQQQQQEQNLHTTKTVTKYNKKWNNSSNKKHNNSNQKNNNSNQKNNNSKKYNTCSSNKSQQQQYKTQLHTATKKHIPKWAQLKDAWNGLLFRAVLLICRHFEGFQHCHVPDGMSEPSVFSGILTSLKSISLIALFK